jgi:hypothetical protein
VCYLRDGDRVFETYWTTRRGAEAMDYSYALMDLTVYGRQEPWEDSLPGWPQQCSITLTDPASFRPDEPPTDAESPAPALARGSAAGLDEAVLGLDGLGSAAQVGASRDSPDEDVGEGLRDFFH